jgi:uncharacterized protein YukE
VFQIPNSSAIDAAAGGGGPGTVVLPSIITTQPEAIVRYATELGQRVARLAGLFQDLDRARQELRAVWSSGSASDSAIDKLTKSAEAFQRIAGTVEKVITELRSAADAIRMIQTAYRAVVGMVNPVVAALMSNPFTQSAARALASVTTAALKGFLTVVRVALDAIGLIRLVAAATDLVAIAREVERLLSGRAEPAAPALPAGAGVPAGTTSPGAGTTPPGAANPLPVGTAGGAGHLTDQMLPRPATPSGGDPGYPPSVTPSCPPGREPGGHLWIAVDPVSGLRVTDPSPAGQRGAVR